MNRLLVWFVCSWYCLVLLKASEIRADCTLGMIHLFAGPFCPKFHADCNGQTLSIMQNEALFSIVGTMYGGNGQTTFNLPNFQGRIVPGHFSDTAESGGEYSHTLTVNEIPAHNHAMLAAASSADMLNHGTTGFVAQQPFFELYSTQQPDASFGDAISTMGFGLPHENRQPYLVVGRYCICIDGIFPELV